jgi:hypothetical protein
MHIIIGPTHYQILPHTPWVNGRISRVTLHSMKEVLLREGNVFPTIKERGTMQGSYRWVRSCNHDSTWISKNECEIDFLHQKHGWGPVEAADAGPVVNRSPPSRSMNP